MPSLVFVLLYIMFYPPYLCRPERKVYHYKGPFLAFMSRRRYTPMFHMVDMFSCLLRGVYILMSYKMSFTLNLTGEYSPA